MFSSYTLSLLSRGERPTMGLTTSGHAKHDCPNWAEDCEKWRVGENASRPLSRGHCLLAVVPLSERGR